MSDFPILSETGYVNTRMQLHSIAKVFGKFRETLVKPSTRNDNLWLKVTENGFDIPTMEQYGHLTINCNLNKLRIEVIDPKFVYTIDLEENSVYGITNELKRILGELRVEFDSSKVILLSDNEIALDRDNAGRFLIQLVNFDKMLETFWNSLKQGTKTQICLWPEHFDNAFIWYSGRKINGAEEQIGVGISNGDDELNMPYIYMTPWPIPLSIDNIELTEGAYLHTEGWTGFVLPYTSLESRKGYEPQRELINNFFISTFEKIETEFKKR